ncbi:MAG: lytic murein transglycosylase [Patulibacter sp.]
MRATWSTAGALAALALPATAIAADAPTVPRETGSANPLVTTTAADAAAGPAPAVTEPSAAVPPAADPATVPPAGAPPVTVPPARGEPGDAAEATGPGGAGGAGGAKDPSAGAGSTGSAGGKGDRDREATKDADGSAKDREDAKGGKPGRGKDGTPGDRKDRKGGKPGDGKDRQDAKGGKPGDGEGDETADDPSGEESASSAADLLLGGATRGLADLSVEDFRIPPFLLPIYQAAGVQYGIRWEILAAINEIETDYGRNLSVSTAGALGWMQFMPGTWKSYGVDATGDGQRDPYNPVDAIFAAARYLQASGAATDIRKAIFAYNHADWYVNDVLRRAQAIARLPADVVASLSGLTLAQLPVYVARVEDAEEEEDSDPAVGVSSVEREDGQAPEWAIVRAPVDAPVVAVQDATVTRIGESPRWGRYVELRDAFGNRYVYAGLGELAREHLVPRGEKAASRTAVSPAPAVAEPTSAPTTGSPAVGPSRPATAAEAGTGRPIVAGAAPVDRDLSGPETNVPVPTPVPVTPTVSTVPPTTTAPVPPAATEAMTPPAPSPEPVPTNGAVTTDQIERYLVRAGDLRGKDLRRRPLRIGSKVAAGTVLARLDPQRASAPRATDVGGGVRATFRFAIRPAGEDSGRIDPRPILDGWRLLDDAAVFGNELPTAFAADRDDQPDVGRVLLLSKQQLQQRVLANPRLTIYPGGRDDIQSGAIDRRVLATMEYLTAHGLRLTITSLKSGHSIMSASGNVSAHSYGAAFDIAVVNGTVLSAGTQGPGSITDKTNRLLLQLQGTMRPNQIISLMTYPGTDNTLAMADHDDHIHVGFPQATEDEDGPVRLAALKVGATTLGPNLRRDQWESLVAQLGTIENPAVRPKVSKSALPDPKATKAARKAKQAARAKR